MFIFTFEFVGSKINKYNVSTQQQKSAEVKYDSFIFFKFSVWFIMKLVCSLPSVICALVNMTGYI